MRLNLSGNHPAAAWLAVYLAHRGWDIRWRPPQRPIAGSYLGVAEMLFDYLGETRPAWPLECCLQEINGFSNWSDQGQHQLQSWKAYLLGLPDCAQEFGAELHRLGLLSAESPEQADWQLDFSFAPCVRGCQLRERSGTLDKVYLPSGVLEQVLGGSERLNLTMLGPQRAAFSYLAEPDAEDLFWQRLYFLLPDTPIPQADLPWRKACRCLPWLECQAQSLRLQVPYPSLQLTGFLQQSVAWVLAQFLGRRLGDETLSLDQLGPDSGSYLEKAEAAVTSVLKSYKILGIQD